MTTYERCKRIREMIMTRSAEVMNYENWSDDFAAKQIRDFAKDMATKDGAEPFMCIQPCELTLTEMVDLGFGLWSDDSPMRLIPLWLYQFLADEIIVESISGDLDIMKKSEMDTDHRFGCLAFGVKPKKVD